MPHPLANGARRMGHPTGAKSKAAGEAPAPQIPRHTFRATHYALTSSETSGVVTFSYACSMLGFVGRLLRPKQASFTSLKIVWRFSLTTFSQASFPIMGK